MHAWQHYLSNYGYLTLFLVVLMEGFGIPAPGQTLLIAAAVLAAQGKLSIAAVLATAFLAAFTGNSIGYWIGARGGSRVIARFGRYVGIGEQQMRRMEGLFTRHGVWFVTFARFFEVLRQLNGVVAGTAGMPLRSFLAANAAGAALWAAVWGVGAWRLGQHIHTYEELSEKTGWIAVALLISGLLGLLVLFLVHHWRNHRDPRA